MGAIISSSYGTWPRPRSSEEIAGPAPGITVSDVAHRATLAPPSRRAAPRCNAIIDKDVVVLDGAQIGCDKEHDRARAFVVTYAGVTVAGKGQHVPC